MSNVFERVALANQTELAVSRSSSGASSGENLAFVGDASQGNCVISIKKFVFDWAVRRGRF